VSWSVPLKLPFEYIPARILTDASGMLTAVDGSNKLHRSFDNGQSWLPHSVETLGIHSINFDYNYLQDSGNLRFQTYSTTTGKVKVWTVGFSGAGSPSKSPMDPAARLSANRK